MEINVLKDKKSYVWPLVIQVILNHFNYEDAGSDVANMTCVAKISSCGKFYIVNGVKKWITNGAYADYFVTAVRTGDAGMFGISMLLIEV